MKLERFYQEVADTRVMELIAAWSAYPDNESYQAMLLHLYEVHKLRDQRLHEALHYHFQYWSTGSTGGFDNWKAMQ